jgi:hypothetical protein
MSDFDNTDTSWSVGGIVDVGSKSVHPAYGPRGSATTSARCCVVVCKKTESGPCKIEPLQASCCRVERNVGEAENELQRTIAAARLYDFPTLCRSGEICQLRILYCRKYSHRPHRGSRVIARVLALFPMAFGRVTWPCRGRSYRILGQRDHSHQASRVEAVVSA